MSSIEYIQRHLGPRERDIQEMLKKIRAATIEDLIKETIPDAIRINELPLPDAIDEITFYREIRAIASRNKICKNYIGQGYYDTQLPPVIQRNILENPAWYTSYTPYQAEISQGRLEALLNFQTMIVSFTGMPVANASLLDESTAAAEAMVMAFNMRSKEAIARNDNIFLVDTNIFPHITDVVKTRSMPLGIQVIEKNYMDNFSCDKIFAALIQYPAGDGDIRDYTKFVTKMHNAGALVVVVADLLSLALLKPPAEWGADIVVGSSQRFGIPMGFGGPYAAYFACREEYKRNMPGRIIGVSIDRSGKNALRMALQTREQHIKRERATSNICTAQALLAIMAGMYAVYHGPQGIKNIAQRINTFAYLLSGEMVKLGYSQKNSVFFDTIKVEIPKNISVSDIKKLALERACNLHYINESLIGISINETTTLADINELLEIFAIAAKKKFRHVREYSISDYIDKHYRRTSAYLDHDVFNRYHSETEMMRYIKRLEQKDLSLVHSMIPLGSCTMKLNAAIAMMPVSWPEFGRIHPYAPLDQVEGYFELIHELGKYLKAITGFGSVSFQPNSGAAGEYAGLMVIRQYHLANKQEHRNVVLIPASAHGTNPASAAAAGFRVVVVDCDNKGNVSMDSLKHLAEEHKHELAAFMVTYPSTHGVFEPDIKEMTAIIHSCGGQVYMDGANMNALMGLTGPKAIGADVCHINLHKTFAIPHGGGGPGMGPIAVAEHLVEFLPTHPIVNTGGIHGIGAVSAAPYGSAGILPISYAYCRLASREGLRKSSQIAILNANYLAACLKDFYPVLYTNPQGRVAHELIIDCRPLKNASGITETDIAKRLMDYGFHAPTLSFPVHGTLMIEPTESESKEELDRFVDAMISIYKEIQEIIEGKADKDDNVLKNAPHTIEEISADTWGHSYTRRKAVFPLQWIEERKFWPSVGRINDAYGDRNLMCECTPIDEYRKELMKTEYL